ncbi:MAG: PDZ domain-containing protein [Pirellulaceae bacterium]
MKTKRNLVPWHTFVCIASCVAICAFACPASAQAQLSDEMRELFQDIKNEFEDDIRIKLEEAIKNDTDKVTFSTDQFLRFRSNPINPFEGLENINADELDGSIQLKFEVPTARNRMIGVLERQNPGFLSGLQQVVASQNESIVEIMGDSGRVCLGTVVDSRGTVLTKASELKELEEIRIRDFQNVRYSASILKVDEANDLAILKTNARHLPAIIWSQSEPELGSFLLTASPSGKVVAMGSYSHRPRSLATADKGFLGVTPRTVGQGVELTDITPGSAADLAGLQVGDIVVGINQAVTNDVAALVARIQSCKAGDSVKIEYLRGATRQTATAVLAGRNLSPDRAARFKMMNRLGAIPSERSQDFPWVFQHDSPLFPEDCGGPVFDLDGNVVGVNIARQGRVSTLAIPTRHVKTLLAELQRENLAAVPDSK